MLRHSGWALLLTAAGVAACSNSPPPPPDTFVNAAVGGGPMCASYQSPQRWLQIGTALPNHPNTVQDGGSDRNATVNVSCTVHPQGNGFDIQLSAIENGTNGGSLTITSPEGQGAVTTMTSSGISASFIGLGGISYREQANSNDPTGCTITYEYDEDGTVGGVGGDTAGPVSPPIAAGRIWGHIKCPKAISEAMPSVVCDAESDFIFEQCQQ